MSSPYRILLAAGASALLLAGCNDSSSSSDADPTIGTEQPGNPAPVIVPAPVAEQPPEFIVKPYLQSPGSDTMTVMFETENTDPQVWVRPFDSSQESRKMDAGVHSEDGLVYRAVVSRLEPKR